MTRPSTPERAAPSAIRIPISRAARHGVCDLRGGIAQTATAGRRWTLRDGLVIGQMAVTVVLLVCAGLLTRSLAAAQNADVGFRTGGLAVLSVDFDLDVEARRRVRGGLH